MKITDLKIGEFATRNWYSGTNKILYVKRFSEEKYEYWENGQFSSSVKKDSSIFNHNDFKLCDRNGKLIEKLTYPLYMESIIRESRTGRVVKFDSLNSGKVIIQGNSNTLVGYETSDWVEHTRIDCWKPCDFSKAPEIEDLDFWDARYNAGLPIYYTNKEGISSIIVAQKPSDYVKYQAKGTYKFYIQDESKPEFTYPMYFECIRTHSNEGMIVKFKTIEIGQIVKSGKKLGATKEFDIKGFTMHTDQQTWKQVNFDETICKIIPTQDDIDELISDLKSIIEDDDNRFSPSEYGAGTQLKESGHDQCLDLINEWMEKYYITKAPDIGNEKDFIYFDDLFYVIEYIKGLLYKDCDKQDDYESKQKLAFIPNEKAKSRLYDDALDAIQYLTSGTIYNKKQGATEVVNKLNQIKEFTMTKELQEAILELIATNGKPKVKKPKTPKIVCNVEGTLMEFADEAALKSFMWSSRVESVIRYDLTGKVTVPFELSIEAPKKQKQTKVTV